MRKRLCFWGTTLGLLLLVCATICLWQYSQVRQIRQQAEEIEKKAQSVKAIVAKTAKLRLQHQAFLKEHAPVTALEQTQNPLQLLALIGLGTEHVQVHVREFTYQQTRQEVVSTRPAPEAKPAMMTGAHLRLSGVAKDDFAIARFVEALKQHHVFDSVDLKSTAETTWNNGPARTYLVECAL